MSNLYKVTYEVFVVAGFADEAEERARDFELTIQDDSIRAKSVKQIIDFNLVNAAKRFVCSMSDDGFKSTEIYNALKHVVIGLGYNLSKDELDALYKHCEFCELHREK